MIQIQIQKWKNEQRQISSTIENADDTSNVQVHTNIFQNVLTNVKV